MGTIGVYSFNGTKLLVTGEGGMLVTDDRRLYQRCKGLAHHGLLMRGKRSRLYWSYELGYKYKMTNIQAALGIAQLERIEELVSRRRRIHSWYAQRLGQVEGLELNHEGPDVKSTFWLTVAVVNRRVGLTKEAVVRQLKARGVDGRPFFYPLSAMPPFAPYCAGKNMRKCNPVAYELSPYAVCLPSAFSLTETDVAYVCKQLVEILRQAQPRTRRRLSVPRRAYVVDHRATVRRPEAAPVARGESRNVKEVLS